MKLAIIRFFVFLLICSTSAVAQTSGDFKNIYTEAEDFFINENYTTALPLYIKLDSIQPENANINFKIGFCYLNSATYKTKSIPYLAKAITSTSANYKEGEIKEKKAPLSSFYYLAKAYHLNYEFDKAIEMYEKYKMTLGDTTKAKEDVEEINRDIETCRNGKEIIKSPKNVVITNLGDSINSPYPDYSPVLSLDEKTLVFTSRRTEGTSELKELNGSYYEDIFISHNTKKKWEKAALIGTSVNTFGHEASVNLSADGKSLLIFKGDAGNGDIFLSELDNGIWGMPRGLGATVNTLSWESHACFSSNNKILYIVSDRPGGFGGRDIYKCLRLPNGEWGPAQNLGATINTKYDEDGVFIHPNGTQIYFASKGHNSMGGFDIFTSIINDENGFWSEPINIGYPINTTDDDVFYITSADGDRGYYSSDKAGGFGDKDIYLLTFPDIEPRNVTVLVGKIINNTGKKDLPGNTIDIIDMKTNEIIETMEANLSTGKFGCNLPIDNKYKIVITINNEEIYSEEIAVLDNQGAQVIKREIPYGTPPPPPAVDTTAASVVEKTKKKKKKSDNQHSHKICDPEAASFSYFFAYNKKGIEVKSRKFEKFIDAAYTCITLNENMVINIEASASTVPTSTYKNNQKLAEKRLEDAKLLVTDALVKKGVKKSQINFNEKAIVSGPDYNNDPVKNEKTYEQYQYTKITTEVK